MVAKATPDNAITNEVQQESHCCFGSMGGHPILLKMAILFTPFLQSSEVSPKS
jgi:hypothetical protein